MVLLPINLKNINKRIKTVKITYKSIHDKYMGSLNTSYGIGNKVL